MEFDKDELAQEFEKWSSSLTLHEDVPGFENIAFPEGTFITQDGANMYLSTREGKLAEADIFAQFLPIYGHLIGIDHKGKHYLIDITTGRAKTVAYDQILFSADEHGHYVIKGTRGNITYKLDPQSYEPLPDTPWYDND